jgi:hypothetical protein
MPQSKTGRRKISAASPSPRPRYKTVALSPETYYKVVVWADHLREQIGRCTIGEAIDYLVDSAGVPNEEEAS